MAPLADFWSKNHDFGHLPGHRFFDLLVKGENSRNYLFSNRKRGSGPWNNLDLGIIFQVFFGLGRKKPIFQILEGSGCQFIVEGAILGPSRERDGALKSAQDRFIGKCFFYEFRRDPKSMKIGSWSHVGSRWHLLGALLAQDDPEDRVCIDFWPIWGSPKYLKNRFKNQAIFRHP